MHKYPVVTTTEQLHAVVDHYRTQSGFCIDVETSGEDRLDPRRNRITWVALACKGRADVIPMGHPNGEYLRTDFPLLPSATKRIEKGLPLREADYSKDQRKGVKVFGPPPEQLDPAEVFSALKPLLMNPDIAKVGHNIAFDAQSIAKYIGEQPVGPYFDTMIGSFIVDSRYKNALGLDDCLKRTLEHEMIKGVGKNVDEHPFDVVAEYAYRDARWTWLLSREVWRLLTEVDGIRVMQTDMQVLEEAVCPMEMTGALLDVEALKALQVKLEADIESATGDIYRAAGRLFNLNSNPEKQRILFGPNEEGGRGLVGKILTPKGKSKRNNGQPITPADMAVSAPALELFPNDALATALLVYADLNKLMTTYVVPYLGGDVTRTTAGKSKTVHRESLMNKGRIHTQFLLHGADTGRFTCVSGDTLISTNRGTFRFDEYTPLEGDCVVTHRGRWMPVTRKIYKGTQEMFRVRLENGSVMHCTVDHRVLTPTGWQRLGGLAVGDEVTSYGRVEIVRERQGESAGRGRCVYCGGQADATASSPPSGHHVSQRATHREYGSPIGESESREGSALLTLEDGSVEPYAGQEWFPAPSVCGGSCNEGRLLADYGGREVRVGAPARFGSGTGTGLFATMVRRSSHRQGQAEQLSGQPGVGDKGGAWSSAQESSRLIEITSVGSMGVWDISVAGDESYLAQGFLNHNSRNPNMQNVPNPRSANGRAIRNLFVAPPQEKQIVADYSQIEPRVTASLTRDPVMLNAYATGQDIYSALAEPFGVDRSGGKVLMLSMMYGVGPETVAAQLGVPLRRAERLLEDFSQEFHKVVQYKSQVVRDARSRRPEPYVNTLLGRRRYLPDLMSSSKGFRMRAERQAFNCVIQGTAADIMKLAMIRAAAMIPAQARLILTVHDEMVTTTPKHCADETAAAIREAMEGVKAIDIPLVADIKVVNKWGEAK